MLALARSWRWSALAARSIDAGPCAAEQVDLLLVLAADVSRSVDQPKFQLQRDGYAAALSDPRVLKAIKSGAEPAHRDLLRRMVGRRRPEARDRLDRDRRRREPRASSATSCWKRRAPSPTAPRSAAASNSPWRSSRARRSKPGAAPSTCRATAPTIPAATCRIARDEAVAKGVTINGLVILSERPLPWNPEHTNPPGGLAKYFRDNVIGGPGAFVIVARGFQILRPGADHRS